MADVLKKEIRCSSCNRLIGKGEINDGAISLKCKCGKENTIIVSSANVVKKIGDVSFQDRIVTNKKDDSLSFSINKVPDNQ